MVICLERGADLHMAQRILLPLTVSCSSKIQIVFTFLVPAPGWSRTTHTRLTALCPGLPGWAGTRKVKPIWILLKQETVSGSGISWAICKSASRYRQITMPAPGPGQRAFKWVCVCDINGSYLTTVRPSPMVKKNTKRQLYLASELASLACCSNKQKCLKSTLTPTNFSIRLNTANFSSTWRDSGHN